MAACARLEFRDRGRNAALQLNTWLTPAGSRSGGSQPLVGEAKFDAEFAGWLARKLQRYGAYVVNLRVIGGF